MSVFHPQQIQFQQDHQEEHLLGNPRFTAKFCLLCYPIRNQRSTQQFRNFWDWISGYCFAESYTTYTLTVTNSCGCPQTATATVNVTSSITPTFNPVAPICSGATAPVLPTTSTNGINGTWAPVVSNTASGTYTFTPAVGQCATTTTLNVTVTPNVIPTFNPVASICSGSVAPVLATTSTNGASRHGQGSS